MRKLILILIPLTITGCSGKDFVQGSFYQSACENVFVDDNNNPGKWNAAPNGSCTGGPFQTAYYAVKGAL